MKDYPQNTQQWAQEAYDSLESAWASITQGNPFPTETQKRKLIEIAASMACENRDINDLAFIEHAQNYALEEFMIDFNSRDLIEKINFSLCFLLAYFDAHLSLSMIKKDDITEIISYLKTHFTLDYEVKAQNNVLSINYSSKN